jgi:protoporphyrin/coproporphyrin ferrochelatase
MNSGKKGVVLFQLGGPDTLDAVEPFLTNLFRDPDIIDVPGAFLFRRLLATLISSRRAPRVRELYRRIGGGSPILAQTTLQANRLREVLEERGYPLSVYIAMRYWHPLTEEVYRRILHDGVNEVILLPLYPQYSKATTGSSMKEWNRVVRASEGSRLSVKAVESYFDNPLYVEALVENITGSIAKVPAGERMNIHLVFSAHGTPLKLVREGDPYSKHIEKTYRLVVEKGNFGLPHHLCFQSKIGPQRWLEPSLTEMIRTLAHEKVSHVIVIPMAFVTEHIETLSEINIEAREEAESLGIGYFDMMPALLAGDKFIACLAGLVIEKMHEPTFA